MICVYRGKIPAKIKTPAIPTITAEIRFGILGVFATPKTTIPATIDDRDLWSLRKGTESNTELILGTKNGAMRLAERTATIARSVTIPVTFAPIPFVEKPIKKSELVCIDKTDQPKVMPKPD